MAIGELVVVFTEGQQCRGSGNGMGRDSENVSGWVVLAGSVSRRVIGRGRVGSELEEGRAV